MDKLDNYIYYSICDKSYDLFLDTYYMSYRTFCYSLKASIETENLSGKEHNILNSIHNDLLLIYSLDSDTCFEYIGEYFLSEKFLKFEEPVRLVKDYFKNSFN